jgi:hypothetical protein
MTVSQILLDIRGNVLVPPQLTFGSNTPVSFLYIVRETSYAIMSTEGASTARRLELHG